MKCDKVPFIPLRRLVLLNPPIKLPESGDVEYLPMDRIKNGYYEHQSSEISNLPKSLSAFSEGDILLAKVTPCFENGNLCIAKELTNNVGVGSTELFVLRIISSIILPDYLLFLFQQDRFKSAAVSEMRGTGGLKRIPPEWLLSYKFPVPSLEVQKEIVNRLNTKLSITSVLSQKLSDKRELLETLKESLVTRLVTKGPDLNVPMKDSGIPWIGNIPDRWSCMRLAHCFSSVNRPANLDLPVLTVSIHTGISDTELNDEDRDRKVWLSEDRSKYQCINNGDLVYNMMRAWQGAFGTCTRTGLVSPAYTVLVPKKGILSKYYELLFRTPNAKHLIYGYSQGIADFRKRLYWEKARDIYVPVPPFEEQIRIADKCDFIDKRIDDLKKEISKQIDLLNEYKSALLASAFMEGN